MAMKRSLSQSDARPAKEARGVQEPPASVVPCVVDLSSHAAGGIGHGGLAEENNQLRALVSSVSQNFVCPITLELMVDPVIDAGGITYERSAKEQPEGLISNSLALKTIEAMVESGVLDAGMSDAWRARKKGLDLKKAQALFDTGDVLEAAKLGLPEAQGKMAESYFFGSDGVEKDLQQYFEWATKAAEGGDRNGQFRLGYAYNNGQGTAQDSVAALKWYKLAAEQGCGTSMNNIGVIYGEVEQDHKAAFTWFLKAAEAGIKQTQYHVGQCCYYGGNGAAKNLTEARKWLQKAADQGMAKAKFKFGNMLMRGEGGAVEMAKGLAMVEAAAAQNNADAKEALKKTGSFFKRAKL